MVETEFEIKEKIAIGAVFLVIVGLVVAFCSLVIRESEKAAVVGLSLFLLGLGSSFLMWICLTRNNESEDEQLSYYRVSDSGFAQEVNESYHSATFSEV